MSEVVSFKVAALRRPFEARDDTTLRMKIVAWDSLRGKVRVKGGQGLPREAHVRAIEWPVRGQATVKYGEPKVGLVNYAQNGFRGSSTPLQTVRHATKVQDPPNKLPQDTPADVAEAVKGLLHKVFCQCVVMADSSAT